MKELEDRKCLEDRLFSLIVEEYADLLDVFIYTNLKKEVLYEAT